MLGLNFALLWVDPLNMIHEAGLAFELPLTRDAFKNGLHVLHKSVAGDNPSPNLFQIVIVSNIIELRILGHYHLLVGWRCSTSLVLLSLMVPRSWENYLSLLLLHLIVMAAPSAILQSSTSLRFGSTSTVCALLSISSTILLQMLLLQMLLLLLGLG